jgi:uncharacterized caspase-like protein
MAAASRAVQGKYYKHVKVSQLINAQAEPHVIYTKLEEMIAAAKPEDTLLVYFAGHGYRTKDARFFMLTTNSRLDRVRRTALDWSKMSLILHRSKARVVVILDACHSGQTGAQQVATNDDAISQLKRRDSKTPIIVLAASKGRQFSEELRGAGGGVFTQNLARIITRQRSSSDTNNNGVIEISELYQSLKNSVTSATDGRQTPWLVRQEMVGDFALF